MTTYKVTNPYTNISDEFEVEKRADAIELYIKKYDLKKSEDDYNFFNQILNVNYISGDIDTIKVMRCIICGDEFSEYEVENKKCCPSCSFSISPEWIRDDVDLKINWHTLRVLTIWSENWARQSDNQLRKEGKESNMLYTIMCIAERLQKQYPEKTKLTFFSEVRELRKEYKIESNADDDSILGI